MKHLRPIRFLFQGVIMMAGLFLTACADMYPDLKNYEATPKTVLAQEFTYGVDVVFAVGDPLLSEEEAARVTNYVSRMSIGKYDRVNLVAYGNGELNPITAGRINAIQSILNSQNVRVDNIVWSPETESTDQNKLRILIDRYLVTLPGCPDWTKSARGSFDNQVHSNWGCATAMNFGAMLAEPHDLIEGRADHTADGAYLLRSIQRYEADQTKETEAQLTNESL